jgi:hypothetical protein
MPSKVNPTAAADGNPPVIAFEPSEFSRGHSNCRTACRYSEKSDFINQAGRIGKGVIVAAMHGYTLDRLGNDVSTAAAQDRLVAGSVYRARRC